MKNSTKYIFLIILLFLLISCDRDMRREKVVGVVKQIHEKILAKVNGIPITISDFQKEKNRLPPHLRELLKSKEKQRQFLDNLITKELLYQEAEKLKLENRKNIKSLIESYKKDLLINELIRTQIKANVIINDKEAYHYYLKHKKMFHFADKVSFYEYIFKDLTDAENFLKNHNISQCNNICKKMKLLKYLDEPDISNISSALNKLKRGEFSEILWTKNGYVILKLIKKHRGRLKPFYKVKEKIYQILREEKEKELLNRYIKVLKSNAHIIIYNDNQTQNKKIQ